MKLFSGLLLALGFVFGASPVTALVVNGHGYTPLVDWANVNGLRLVRGSHGEEVVLTNRTTRLVFAKDSHTAQVNGVNVALSFPVAVDKGLALIAPLDLARTIEPLIFSPRFAGGKISTIVLDPGHGGKDPGNHSGGRYEKTATLALAGELRDQLKSAGFNVVLTRTKDKYVELAERPDLANRQHADLFVSLHFNATQTGKNEVSGPETYCITPVGASSSNAQGEGANYGATPANLMEKKSLLLAYQVQKALVKNLGAEDRSVRRARFAVLRDAEMPAILVESGYMTHPAEGQRIFDPDYRRRIAAAIVKGVLNYQRLTAPEPDKTAGAATNKFTRLKGGVNR